MSSLEVNNQILSPVDSFILEYRAKLLEDQKKLEEKIKNIKNVPQPRTSDASSLSSSAPDMKLASSQPMPTIMVTDCGNKENIAKDQNVVRNTSSRKSIANVSKGGSDFMKNDRGAHKIIQDNQRSSPKDLDNKNTLTRDQSNKNILTRDQSNKIILTRDQSNKNILTRDQSNKNILTRDQSNENILSRDQSNKNILTQDQSNKNILNRNQAHKNTPTQDQENKSIHTQNQDNKNTPNSHQVNRNLHTPDDTTIKNIPTKDQATIRTIPSRDLDFQIPPSRDEEKQRFIDRLISSPNITSPRDESDTPRSRRVLTPDLPLPINQRQADIEKLQDLLSQSPSYVPNPNNVNQFSESFILASSPTSFQVNTPNLGDKEVTEDSNLFDNYVKTFESENHHGDSAKVNAQPMSITTNNFAHDQSCKKIIKIGEYSPLNPHFQPQPSVLNFSSRYHEQGSQTPSAQPDQPPLRSCQRDKRALDAQMPSKKRSKAVQICGPSSSTCTDDDIEVIGTKITSLPDIETKVNPEARYPHLRSQHHVETCGGGDPMVTVKLKQELYKTELDKQIQEKRRGEEERRRREVEEDEKAQRAYEEQQERLRREFELEEESKLQSAMQRQMREEILKEKIRELQLQQEEEKARRRREKEASQGRYKRETENRHPWGSGAPHGGNPSSIMQPNPFGAPLNNSRLEPIRSKAAAPEAPMTCTGTQGQYLAPPPSHSRQRGASRDVSPCRSYVDDAQYRHGDQSPISRDVSPLRPPIERFRDISPVRPLRETLPGSPSLGCNKEEGALISKAPLELSMPLRRGKHHRVSFIKEPSTSPAPSHPRPSSPVLPAVRTHHRMKDLATTVPCSPCPENSDSVLKNATNRNVLTQLGQFRRQLYLENLRMNERLRQNEYGDGCQ